VLLSVWIVLFVFLCVRRFSPCQFLALLYVTNILHILQHPATSCNAGRGALCLNPKPPLPPPPPSSLSLIPAKRRYPARAGCQWSSGYSVHCTGSLKLMQYMPHFAPAPVIRARTHTHTHTHTHTDTHTHTRTHTHVEDSTCALLGSRTKRTPVPTHAHEHQTHRHRQEPWSPHEYLHSIIRVFTGTTLRGDGH
jgi:hypothetical protein